MTRRYPKGMAVQAEPPDWVSQHDAARELGIHVLRVGFLISNEHLEPAETALREMGVTRDSLDQERRWRSAAPCFNGSFARSGTRSTASSPRAFGHGPFARSDRVKVQPRGNGRLEALERQRCG